MGENGSFYETTLDGSVGPDQKFISEQGDQSNKNVTVESKLTTERNILALDINSNP